MASSEHGVERSAEAQQAAARRLLADMLVSNSDIHGEDAAEAQRLQAALAADRSVEAGGLAEEEGGSAAYKDPVQAAFENYGQITDEILAEWKEMFALFDFDSTGFIKTDDLGTVLRGLGRNLTEEFIATLINSYDANGSGALDFPTFYRLMIDNSPMPGPCNEPAVFADFHVFDMYRDGLIPVVDLVHLLRHLGEPLTREDVDHLLAEIYIDGDNRVDIKNFVQHMFRTSAPNPES